MDFLAKKIREREEFISKNASPEEQKELLKDLLATATAMHSAGVSSEDDYKDFFYVSSQSGNIAKDILGYTLGSEDLAKVSHYVFSNRDEFPINTIINFYNAVKNAIDNYKLPIKKIAYPQGFENKHIRNPYNMNKWVDAMRQIYAYRSRGYEFGKAFNTVTAKWEKMEKTDFSHWLDYYQSGEHQNYKTAQHQPPFQKYYTPGEDAGQIPFAALQTIDKLRAGLRRNKEDEEERMNAEDAKIRSFDEKKKTEKDEITDKMTKLIGRLNSAEKIFTSVDFKKVLDEEYDEWLECLHKLKRIIYSKQPKTASIIGDIIVRQGNKLRASGYHKAGRLMDILAAYQVTVMNELDYAVGMPISKYAQTAPPSLSDNPLGEMDDSTDILGGGGAISGDDERNLSDPEGAMAEFIENLGGKTKEDNNKVEDKTAGFDEDDAYIIVAEDGFYRFAQAAPAPGPGAMPVASEITPAPDDPKQKVTPTPDKPEISGDPEAGDDAIDAALRNTKIEDVIAKLEGLVQFYRNRQFSRELLIIDLMLEALGISAFFPSMAEAAKSSLDSNQYVLTRLEDMLAKLRGAAAAGDEGGMKAKLEQELANKDKKRENKAKLDMSPPQEVPEGQEGAPPAQAPAPEKELAQPAKVEQSPQPAQVR